MDYNFSNLAKKATLTFFFHSGHQFQKARTYVFPFAVVVTFRVEGNCNTTRDLKSNTMIYDRPLAQFF